MRPLRLHPELCQRKFGPGHRGKMRKEVLELGEEATGALEAFIRLLPDKWPEVRENSCLFDGEAADQNLAKAKAFLRAMKK